MPPSGACDRSAWTTTARGRKPTSELDLPRFVGTTRDGGYAEMMLARATGLVSIPDELDAHDAAPLLCAGLATFNALKKCGAEAGDTVAILGIGGLGHLALQYARRMGFRVVAIGRGADIAHEAIALGAHRYVDTLIEDAVAALKQLHDAYLRLKSGQAKFRVVLSVPALPG